MTKHERPSGLHSMTEWEGLPSFKTPAHIRKSTTPAMSVIALTYYSGGGADGSIIRFAKTELANRASVQPVVR